MWARLCEAIGRKELLASARVQGAENCARRTGRAQRGPQRSAFEAAKRGLGGELNDAGVPCGPIYAMDQVFADPQVQHLQAAAEVDHAQLGRFKVVNQAVKLSRTPSGMAAATPEIGQHTDEDPARDRLLRERHPRHARAKASFDRRDQKRSEDRRAQGRRDRLARVQQSGAAQRRVAGHVGSDSAGARGFRRRSRRSAWSCSPARASKAFVSGADISQFEKQRSSAEAVQRYEEIGEAAQAKLQGFDKPTIAMIRGYCIGGGPRHRGGLRPAPRGRRRALLASRRRSWGWATAPRR